MGCQGGIVGQQIGLGSLVGLLVGLVCWRGNQSLQGVSTFPDLFTLAVMAALLAAGIHFILRKGQAYGRAASLGVGIRVALAAGTVFGSIVVVLGLFRFSNPEPRLLAFGFLTAFGTALLCGVVAALFPSHTQGPRAA